ncbi:uncharacterized protein LOC129406818 isoform X3 [Sorex araneus]|uniref:uncharacterized protein LOC129406818 isoform X3 n=1 Tax=Sorex araneus TaxID=42254 RepID=UPI00243365A8|nr:uncharacterized protein LOC129406818 isoform X3 [Sorex araneus]
MESEHIDFPATDAGGSPDEELQRKCNNLILLHAAGPRHTCRPELTCSGSIPETRLHRTRPLPASEGLLQRGRKAKCSDGWIYTAALPVTEHQAVTKEKGNRFPSISRGRQPGMMAGGNMSMGGHPWSGTNTQERLARCLE